MKFIISIFLLVFVVLNPGFIVYSQNIDSLLSLYEKQKIDTNKVNTANELIKSYVDNNDLPKAERLAKENIKSAQNIGFFKGLAQTHYLLGRAMLVNGNYPKALEHNLECLRLREDAEKARDPIASPKQMSALYSNVGMCYLNMGIYDKSLQYNLKSLKIKQQLKDSLGIARSYNNIGNVYEAQGNNKMGLSYQRKALQLMEKLNNQDGIASAYNNIGNIYIAERDYDNALIYHQKALDLRIKNQEWLHVGQSYNNLGNIYFETEKFDLALKNFTKAEPLIKDAGDLFSLSAVYINIGEIYRKQGSYTQAIEILFKALKTTQEAGSKAMEADAYEAIATLYNKMGKNDLAYNNLRNYLNIHDSIYQAETSDKIAEMQTKFETEQKNSQIEKLKKEKLESELKHAQQEAQVTNQRYLIYLSLLGLIGVSIVVFLQIKQNRQKSILNNKLEERNKEIADINKDITDSIIYAKRIQLSILPDKDLFNLNFKEHLVYYQPKDIVSGDFYWMQNIGNKILIAAVDCTGHGVPGAFISLVGSQILKSAVIEKKLWRPNEILDFLNEELTETLHQKQLSSNGLQAKDGMDLALVCIDKDTNKIYYSGAFNPLWVVREGRLIETRADKISIGSKTENSLEKFSLHEISLIPNDKVFVFSDGYADQFGGPKGKKFKYKSLSDLLCSTHDYSMELQQLKIKETFETWKGNNNQVDDVLLIGFKVA